MLHHKDDMELLFQLRARAKEGGGAGEGSRVGSLKVLNSSLHLQT